jgi:hypothetical protein
VDTEISYKEAKEKGHKPVLAASIDYRRNGSVYCASAFYAYDCIVVDFCATIAAIHVK